MITDHAYLGEMRSGTSCQFEYNEGRELPISGHKEVCARQAMEHEVTPALNIQVPDESFRIRPALSTRGLRGKATSPEAAAIEEAAARGTDVVRAADAAQYARPAIPQEQRGQIRVRLLNATPDPLGSVAALIEQYKGNVIRSLSEVTDDQRRAALADMGKTVLSGPLEAVQFHWQIEGVTRSITHQMVRSRASFFAQESLRFAVPEGNWAEEIPLPPSLSGAREERKKAMDDTMKGLDYVESNPRMRALDAWEDAMINAEGAYQTLIGLGLPAEEARGVLPHDMPTRIHWVCDLRTLLAEAGKRTCTQAQFPWRMIFAGMASALRTYDGGWGDSIRDLWQFRQIANALRPVCFQTGKCGFMAQFDRSCKIRARVDANASLGRDPSTWGLPWIGDALINEVRDGVGFDANNEVVGVDPIADYEWAADPSAARS